MAALEAEESFADLSVVDLMRLVTTAASYCDGQMPPPAFPEMVDTLAGV